MTCTLSIWTKTGPESGKKDLLKKSWRERVYLECYPVEFRDQSFSFRDYDAECGIPSIIRDTICDSGKISGCRADELDMSRYGDPVNAGTVRGDPERLVSKGKDCTPVGHLMRVFHRSTVHFDPGIPVMCLHDPHVQQPCKPACVERFNTLAYDSFIVLNW
jgi:hypothetical protein